MTDPRKKLESLQNKLEDILSGDFKHHAEAHETKQRHYAEPDDSLTNVTHDDSMHEETSDLDAQPSIYSHERHIEHQD